MAWRFKLNGADPEEYVRIEVTKNFYNHDPNDFGVTSEVLEQGPCPPTGRFAGETAQVENLGLNDGSIFTCLVNPEIRVQNTFDHVETYYGKLEVLPCD